MASDQASAAAAVATAADNEGDHMSRTVTIHIVSPSLPGTSRFTLHDVPLNTTVGQLRVRITQSFPNRPEPSTQRLIYRGRPLTNDGHRLSRLLTPPEVGLQPSLLPLTSYLLESHLTNTSPRKMSTRFTWSYHPLHP